MLPNSASIKIAKQLLALRPAYSLIRNLSQQDTDELFTFYGEDGGQFCEKYRPLGEEDYKRFISTRAAKREPALTRQMATLAYKVGNKMLSLAEGMPNEEVFPFNRVTLEKKAGGSIVLEGQELATALQYVPSKGLPALVEALQVHQQRLHRPPGGARGVLVTNGSQHGIYQCFELLVEPGDPVIMSEYAYTGAQIALKPFDPEILGIPEDSNGINPEILESILKDRLAKGLKMPKVFYSIPTGNNPTGVVISAERRKYLYELACKYDFLIVEDDPYMFLNYTETRAPTFLSMDYCGRVLRLDSLSKVVSAGLRSGWTYGPTPLVDRMELHSQAELLHSCSLSQTILYKLLSDPAGLASSLVAARALYSKRRDALHAALVAASLGEVAEWDKPDAGLFLWLRVKDVDDVYNMVFETALRRGLMLIPGHAFLYDARAPSRHVRLTFSKIRMEDMNIAARHLAEIIRDEQRRKLHNSPQRLATER